jgi:hypothetical protein
MRDDPTRARLRLEVGRFRARESRRVFDTAVYVGRLDGPRDSFVARARDLTMMDAGLRIDVVAALVEATAEEARQAWITRAGIPAPHDEDLAWLAAAISGFGIHGRPLDGFYVFTRTGWLDPRSGESRTWKRLRL